MIIRQATKKDIARIYSMVLTATRRGRILRRSRPEIAKSIHHFWVAEQQGKIIACCALEVYNKKLAEVRSLAVEVDHQRKGIATALLQRCIRKAKKQKIYEILAITDRESLFRRCGFSEQLHGQKALFLRPNGRLA